MEAELRNHLIALAAAYGSAKGMEPTTVAQRAAGDWRFFKRLEESTTGASFTVRKYDAIVAWFVANWPDGVERPAATVAMAQDAAA